MKTYPFFFVVDDGGFPHAGHAEEPRQVGMENYRTILRIAKRFSLRIPICFTMKYLDKSNISGEGTPIGYLDDLIAFLKENHDCIEIGYHGLTHEYNHHVGEFYCLDTRQAVPVDVQQEHIEKSAHVFSDLGLAFPKVFVPPYHAWEWGVTDRLVSGFGVKYLISFARKRYGNRRYQWRPSRWLRFLPREEMAIYSYHTVLNSAQIALAKKLLLPRTAVNNLSLRRTLLNVPVHSYMSHIGNFFPENYDMWVELLDWIKGQAKIKLCANNETAVDLISQFRRAQ
jgi:hypothetical protein